MKNEFECMGVWYTYEHEDGEITVLEDMHGNADFSETIWQVADEDLAEQTPEIFAGTKEALKALAI
jgi:hypothetical protein